MDAARAAISKITSRQGHKTDVDEVVNPAVTSETIKPHRHEEMTEAVDREVHQDHYHTTVQPVAHREVIPEKHTHNLAPQVTKEFRHDNEDETRRTVESELGRFQNTSTTHQTTHSQAAAPSVTGEHVHHHVHETVQPVIHKETIQPEVVHTTVPIHEIHHASSTHHGMSALPMKTLDEFKQAGGLVTGSKSHTHEEYEGAPRPYNDKLTTTIEKVLPGHHGSSTTGQTTGGLTSGTHGSSGLAGTEHNRTGGLAGGNNYGSDTRGTHGGLTGNNYDSNTSSGLVGTGSNYDNQRSGLSGSEHNRTGGLSSGSRDYDNGRDSGIGGVGRDSHETSQQHSKPSLMDKLNPKVDANGDGKAGFMK